MKKNNQTKPSTQQYWKSLEERDGDPQFHQENANEFPEGKPSRRDFLKLMGFTVGTVSLVACSRSPVHKALPFLEKPAELTPGLSNWYATTCGGCSAACSLLVKSRDGRPIKIEGNPQSPLNSGGACAVGQASLLSLYDESRLSGPIWKGQGSTWGHLDEKIRNHLASIQAQGKQIVLLSDTITSPTSHQLIQDFTNSFPNTQHFSYDAVSAKAIRDANNESFQSPVIPSYRFDKAKTIVGINADFLGAWISPVEYSKAYAKTRKLKEPIRLSKHYQLESDFSLTGSNADSRIPIQPSQELPFILQLLNEIGQQSGQAALKRLPACKVTPTVVKEIAASLLQHRKSSLVVCGSNKLEAQLAVNAINSLLSNIGNTIDLENPSLQKQGDESFFPELIASMESGKVGAILINGTNPNFDNPFAKEFSKALKQVPLSVSFSNHLDETASRCTAVVPGLTYLEAWNDAQPKSNIFHLAQPLIAPLFDNRSFQDSLLKWIGASQDFYAYLQSYWSDQLFPRQNQFISPKSFWNHSLHEGLVSFDEKPSIPKHSVLTPQAIVDKSLKKLGKASSGLELTLYESIGMRDGRHANNPWAQELPDPVTKVTWDNYIKISPITAKKMGIRQGEIVGLKSASQSLEIPVHIQPGMPEQGISIAIGYGRHKAGKVGNHVGKNIFPLLGFEDGFLSYQANGIKLIPSGKIAKLATTQTHGSMEGRPIIKETSWEKYKINPRSGNEDRIKLISLWPKWETGPEKWGMAIDLNACTGCSACVISCQVENNVPVVGQDEVWRRREMHWIRIDRYYSQSEEAPEVAHQPMMCQHCDNAPCETVCPVLATVHSSDGLNQQVYNRCVGTRYCANNCPYKVRRFNWFDYADNPKFDYYLNNDLGKMVLNPDVVVRSRGVMEKCSMCVQRIQEGKLQAKKSGKKLKDGDIQLACQQSCPTQAITFGNLKDPDSKVHQSVKNDPRYYGVLEELNVGPAVGYLTKVRNKG